MPGTVPDRGGFSSNIFGSPFSETTYAANGARGSGNNVLIDGVDSKNMFTGGFSVQTSQDAVKSSRCRYNQLHRRANLRCRKTEKHSVWTEAYLVRAENLSGAGRIFLAEQSKSLARSAS